MPDARCAAEDLRGPFCVYDFAPDVTLVPGVERLGLHGTWDHELSSQVGFFAEAMFATSDSRRDLAAAPNAYPVSAATPNNPFGEDVLAIYRVTEFGPRRDRFETDAYNLAAGFTGSAGGWSWEAAGGISEVDTRISGVSGYALTADVQAAIDDAARRVSDSGSARSARAAHRHARRRTLRAAVELSSRPRFGHLR